MKDGGGSSAVGDRGGGCGDGEGGRGGGRRRVALRAASGHDGDAAPDCVLIYAQADALTAVAAAGPRPSVVPVPPTLFSFFFFHLFFGSISTLAPPPPMWPHASVRARARGTSLGGVDRRSARPASGHDRRAHVR